MRETGEKEEQGRTVGEVCGSGSSHAYRWRLVWIFHSLLQFEKLFGLSLWFYKPSDPGGGSASRSLYRCRLIVLRTNCLRSVRLVPNGRVGGRFSDQREDSWRALPPLLSRHRCIAIHHWCWLIDKKRYVPSCRVTRRSNGKKTERKMKGDGDG